MLLSRGFGRADLLNGLGVFIHKMWLVGPSSRSAPSGPFEALSKNTKLDLADLSNLLQGFSAGTLGWEIRNDLIRLALLFMYR
jgi:hypothetical protein